MENLNLISIKECNEKLFNIAMSKNMFQFEVYENVINFIKENEFYKDNLYVSLSPIGMYSIIFKYDYIIYGITCMDLDKQTIDIMIKRYRENKNLENILRFIQKPFLDLVYSEYVKNNDIDFKENLYYLTTIRKKLEYNFNQFDYKFVYPFLCKNKEKIKTINRENLKNFDITNNNKIKIYRGMQSKSTNLENALSWSLNKEIAIMFSKRFQNDNKSIVHEKEISLDDILYVYPDDAEYEILFKYDK